MKNSIRNVGVITALLLVSMSAQAALLSPSLAGSTVTYTDIREELTSTGDGSFTGSYNTPVIPAGSDQLVFGDVDLQSSGSDGTDIRGDADLRFYARAISGFGIDEVVIGEGGDSDLDDLTSVGTLDTSTSAEVSLIVTILEVDNAPYFGAPGGDTAFLASFSVPVDGTGLRFWGGSLSVDITQILTGIEYVYGATYISIALDNVLTANSELGTDAVIKKKGAGALAITVETIPEPASAVLLIATTSGLIFIRRRVIG